MKYATKNDLIAAAAATGSTATTQRGAARWVLAHTSAVKLDEQDGLIADRERTLDRVGVLLLQLAGEPGGRNAALEMQIHSHLKNLNAGRIPGRTTTRAQYRRQQWIARIEARLDRTARALGIWSLVDAAELAAALTQPFLDRAAAALAARWPYRRSTSSWAGGGHEVRVTLGTPGASCESQRERSDNGKWWGTNSLARITTDIPTLRAFPNLTTPDGLVVVHAEQIEAREWQVTWVEQGRGVGLKAVSGWLIRGVHVRAATLKAARAKAARSRAAGVAPALKARQAKRGMRDLRVVYISLEDSIAAGNCEPSSKAFAEQVWGKLGAAGACAVRADVVLEIRDDSYTRKALGSALAHVEGKR